MSDSVTKTFKVPKRKKEDSKDNLRQVELTNRDCKELVTTIERSYIDNKYTSVWNLKTVMMVENRELEEKYRQKKSEMKEEGRRDLQDQYGFLLFNNTIIVNKVVKEGLKCKRQAFNGLGNSKLGVYVCRNADVQMKLADGLGGPSFMLVIFKMALGKCKLLATNSADENTEPTPNFDCHVFQQPPRPSDPHLLQLAKSRVYLYEYNDDCEPTAIPRQCLPYAVLTYNRSEKATLTSALKTPVDSYSKRVVPALEKARSSQDSEVSSKAETRATASGESWKSKRDARVPLTDPRVNTLDPRVSAIPTENSDTGLCVPHLSAVPLSVKPPTDPRLAHAAKQVVPGLPYPGYRPKFGPDHEGEERQKQLDHVQQQLLSLQQTANPGWPPLDIHDRPTDPRLARQRDPRSRDPRSLSMQTPVEPVRDKLKGRPPTRLSSLAADDKSRKKISLSDYKRKAPLPKPTEPDLPVEDIETEGRYQSLNPSIQHLPPNFDVPLEADSGDEEYNPEEYYPQSPTSIPPRQADEEFVEKPEDMANTLNALSDPEDASQSPNSVEDKSEDRSEMMGLQEHIENAEDPALAEAMRKLVDHSGNIELFTEALQSLQESAEELGDSLTDPEFLVKIIAEKIESLAKKKDVENSVIEVVADENVKDNKAQDIGDIKSPDAIQSPDVAHNENNSCEVPHIPLEINDEKTNFVVESLKKEVQGLNANEKHQNVPLRSESTYLEIPLPPSSPLKGSKTIVTTHGDNLNVEEMDLESDTDDLSVSPLKAQPSLSFTIQKPQPPVVAKNVFEEALQDKDERLPARTAQSQNHKSKEPINVNPFGDLGFGSEDVDLRKIGNRQQVVIKTEVGVIKETKQVAQAEEPGDVDLRKNIHAVQSDVDLRTIVPTASGDQDMRVAKSNNIVSSNVIDKPVVSVSASKAVMDKSVSEGVFGPKTDKKPLTKVPQSSSSTVTADAADPSFMDRDERRSQSNSPLTISSVFMDIDERVPQSGVPINRDTISLKKSATDIRSRSASPVPPKVKSGEVSKDIVVKIERTDVKIEHLKTDSQSSDGSLFDAYTMSRTKSIKSETTADKDAIKAENTFGDVDWRQAKTSEMGDIDWRNSQSSQRRDSDNTPKQTPSSDAFNSPSSHTETSYSNNSHYTESTTYKTSPFISQSQSMQDIMQTQSSSNVAQYHTTVQSVDTYSSAGAYGSYSTNRLPVQSYSTSATYGGEYKTSSYTNEPDSYGYAKSNDYSHDYESEEPLRDSGSDAQQPSLNFHNVMQNVDFSSLKNILANVNPTQDSSLPTPATETPKPWLTESHSDSEDETQNKPAFCTGLSFLKSKQPKDDFTRAKYTGKAKIQPDVGPPPVNPEPHGIWGKRMNDWHRGQEKETPLPPHNKYGSSDYKPFGGNDNKQFGGNDKPFGGNDNKPFGGNDKKPFGGNDKPFGGNDNKPFGGNDKKPFRNSDNKPLSGNESKSLDSNDSTKISVRESKTFGVGGILAQLRAGGDFSGPGSEREVTDVPSVFNVGHHSGRSGMIPGFDQPSSKTIPGFDMVNEDEQATRDEEGTGEGQPFRFSEDIPDRDIKSMWYIEPYVHDNKKDKKSKRKDSDSEDSDYKHSKRSKTKDKSSRYGDDSDASPSKKRDKKKSTPTKEETGNWQDAILESMEESALKVRSDDIEDIDADSKAIKALFAEKTQTKEEDKKAEAKNAGETKDHKEEVEPGEILDADDSDEEVNLVIDLESEHKKETKSDKANSPEVCGEKTADSEQQPVKGTEDVMEEGQLSAIVIDDEPEEQQKDEPVVISVDADFEDDDLQIEKDSDVIHTQDEMKDFIEDKRKKIVIRLKNETKIVNPKTGKAYTENAVGSAIQVLGQPVKPPQSRSEMQKTQQIQGIQTIGSGQMLTKHLSEGKTIQYRSPSPTMQQSNISSISTRVGGQVNMPQPIVPSNVPPPQPNVQAQQLPPVTVRTEKPVPLHYIHPVTGQTIRYGSVGPSNQPQPLAMRPVQPVTVSHAEMIRPPLTMFVPVQPQGSQGLPIQTIGQPSQPVQNQFPERHPAGVYGKLSGANKTNVIHSVNEVKPAPNYTMSKNSAIKVIQTQKIPDSVGHSNIQIQTHSEYQRDRKRIVIDRRNSSDAKRPRVDETGEEKNRIDSNKMVEVLEQHDIETLAKVKDVLRNTLQSLDNENDEYSQKKKGESGASSELEDGEISDDDDDVVVLGESRPVKVCVDSRNVVINDNDPYHTGQRIPSLGSGYPPDSRVVRHMAPQSFQHPAGTYRTASEWSDMIKYEDRSKVEIIKGKKNMPPATRSASTSELDADLLSKSAVSISKTKQKIVARSQVKTLGEWLKIELETDNIQPLQNIIPYALNTDLSIIPKQRRRKIRLKVKNAIEQKGLKIMNPNTSPAAKPPQATSVSKPKIQPNYSPEVSAEQMDRELNMISREIEKLRQRCTTAQDVPNRDHLLAFSTVDSEIRALLQRSSFFGYPNRRVPNDILIEEEMFSFKSDLIDAFLILTTPISSKPYVRLVQMKNEVNVLVNQKARFASQPAKLLALDEDIKKLHNQRAAVLKSFTGYLNKKRINRLQELVDKYTMVYNYFKQQVPPVPDHMIRFVRTSQMDLRQHLILAKQYLAMEEKKNASK